MLYGAHKKEISGYEPDTTNNRMELTAAIRALTALKEPCKVELYTDSAYLCNAINKNWLSNWQKNGWKNASKKPVENQDLWLEIVTQLSVHQVHFNKVKGHADNEWNNRCDALATDAVQNGQKRT